MKRTILLLAVLVMVGVNLLGQNNEGKVIYLTSAEFKQKVFDWEANKDNWNYKGKMPAVVDFYADWCGPCKRVAPIMEELAKEYKGKVIFYKVNTDKEREVAGAFGIRSIPSILFIPKTGKPSMQAGAYPKETYKKIIDETLLTK